MHGEKLASEKESAYTFVLLVLGQVISSLHVPLLLPWEPVAELLTAGHLHASPYISFNCIFSSAIISFAGPETVHGICACLIVIQKNELL